MMIEKVMVLGMSVIVMMRLVRVSWVRRCGECRVWNLVGFGCGCVGMLVMGILESGGIERVVVVIG